MRRKVEGGRERSLFYLGVILVLIHSIVFFIASHSRDSFLLLLLKYLE